MGDWDLMSADPIDAEAELSSSPDDRWRFRLSAARNRPNFDLGSVWYYFEPVPTVRVAAGGTVEVADGATIGAGVLGRGARALGENQVDMGGELSASVVAGRTVVAGQVVASEGDLGPAVMVTLDGQRRLVSWLTAGLSLSSWVFDQPDARGLSGASVSEALSVGFDLSDETSAQLDVSHAYSEQVGHRMRLMAVLLVEVWR
jgi:hypothetical protein